MVNSSSSNVILLEIMFKMQCAQDIVMTETVVYPPNGFIAWLTHRTGRYQPIIPDIGVRQYQRFHKKYHWYSVVG